MGKDLRFRRIKLQNWKNFARVEVDLPDRVFLVGPNASGKSNFLDAFRFLRDVASPGVGFLEAIVRKRGGVSAIRCLAARKYPEVEIRVELEEVEAASRWEYHLAFKQDSQRRPQVSKERVLCDGRVLLARPNKNDEADPARLTQTFLEQVNVNQEFRDLATFFATIRYLHVVPQLVREPDRFFGRANDPFGGDLLEQVANTRDRAQKARLRGIQEALRVAVPQLREIDLVEGRTRHAPLAGQV